MLIKLLKLPIKLAALPLIPVLLALHFAGAIVLGISSVITHLLATAFLLGSLAGWVIHAPSSMLYQTVGNGIKDIIRTVSRCAITDEDGFRRRLEKEVVLTQPDNQKQLTKQIRSKEKRIAELEHLLKKLYEDYALGRITEDRFDKLSASYEEEEATLRESLATDQAYNSEAQSMMDRTEQFLTLAKKYRDCTEVTDEMIQAFVDKIVVHRTMYPAPDQRTRQIEVHLNFIGQFNIPTKGMESKNE